MIVRHCAHHSSLIPSGTSLGWGDAFSHFIPKEIEDYRSYVMCPLRVHSICTAFPHSWLANSCPPFTDPALCHLSKEPLPGAPARWHTLFPHFSPQCMCLCLLKWIESCASMTPCPCHLAWSGMRSVVKSMNK